MSLKENKEKKICVTVKMMNRVQKESKNQLYTENKKHEENAKINQRKAISKKIYEENPQNITKKKKALDDLNLYKEGLQNSYLNNHRQLFERLILWPFVKRMKYSESVNAAGRLTLLLSCIYLFLVFTPFFIQQSLALPLFKSIAIVNTYSSIFQVILTSAIPNVALYLFLSFYLRHGIRKSKEIVKKNENLISEREKEFENQLRQKGTDNFYTYSRTTGEEKVQRKPIRAENNVFGSHPGVTGIF